MQFEVNGHPYYLHFVDDEERWYVFEPSITGLQRIPIYVDATKWDRIGMPSNQSKIPN